jgi:hypothetical protein
MKDFAKPCHPDLGSRANAKTTVCELGCDRCLGTYLECRRCACREICTQKPPRGHQLKIAKIRFRWRRVAGGGGEHTAGKQSTTDRRSCYSSARPEICRRPVDTGRSALLLLGTGCRLSALHIALVRLLLAGRISCSNAGNNRARSDGNKEQPRHLSYYRRMRANWMRGPPNLDHNESSIESRAQHLKRSRR